MMTKNLIFLCLISIFLIITILFWFVRNKFVRKKMLEKKILGQIYFSKVDNKKEPRLINQGQILNLLGSSLVSSKNDINKKMLDAGFYTNKFSKYYMHFKYGTFGTVALIVCLYGVYYEYNYKNIIIILTVLFIFCVTFPDYYLSYRKEKLKRKISKQLPYLIDLMAICVKTGLTIEASILYLGNNLERFDKDLSYQVNKLNDQIQVVGVDTALDEFYIRVPTSEVKSFIMSLKQSLKYGTSIYEALLRLSSDIRELQMLSLEEKIGKLSAKMSVPLIAFIMLPIVFVIVVPGVMRAMEVM